MNYLRISNAGLICAEDLTLIGSSTKREQSGKIGMFGSGWKYALSWLLRNGCTPTIFAGEDEIKVDFAVKMHRTNPVNVITVNGIETSLTTEMGPKWTGWMAIREILSNAIDEGGHKLDIVWNANFTCESGNTVIYVPMNGELSEVMLKYDSYFAFNRKETHTIGQDRVFVKKERSPMNIYRKGIRCYDTTITSGIDFDFDTLAINEDRLAYGYNVQYAVQNIVEQDISLGLFKAILKDGIDGWLPSEVNNHILANLKLMIDEGDSFTTDAIQRLGGLFMSKADAIVIPVGWYRKLQDLGLVKSLFEGLGGMEDFIRTDDKNVDGINYYLKALNLDVHIKSGKCESDVFFHNDCAYIKDDTKKSDRQIAAMIVKSMDTDYIELKMG